jgi:hypothetical protein
MASSLNSDCFERKKKLDLLYSPENLRQGESSVKKQLLEKCGKWKAQNRKKTQLLISSPFY